MSSRLPCRVPIGAPSGDSCGVIGSGGVGCAQGCASVTCGVCCNCGRQRVAAERLGAEAELHRLFDRQHRERALALEVAVEADLPREYRRERDDDQRDDQRDAALAPPERVAASSGHLDQSPDAAPVLEMHDDLDRDRAAPQPLRRAASAAAIE